MRLVEGRVRRLPARRGPRAGRPRRRPRVPRRVPVHQLPVLLLRGAGDPLHRLPLWRTEEDLHLPRRDRRHLRGRMGLSSRPLTLARSKTGPTLLAIGMAAAAALAAAAAGGPFAAAGPLALFL